MLKGAYSSLAPNGGKVFQKLVQGLAALQVLQKGLERDAGSAKGVPPRRLDPGTIISLPVAIAFQVYSEGKMRPN
jgi:hypothetical protein